jgi:hypothetical protein
MIDVPISERNWFKLRDVACRNLYTEEKKRTNYSGTIEGEKVFLETPPINSNDWKALLTKALTPAITDSPSGRQSSS